MGFLNATGITTLVEKLKDKFALKAEMSNKQDILVSGTNIKTVNGNSLLGSGNVQISYPSMLPSAQIRLAQATHKASDTGYKYRLWLTSADGTMWVPINTSSSTSSSTEKTLNTRPIDPFGQIIYFDNNGTTTSGNDLTVDKVWMKYGSFTIGYSYVISLTQRSPIYLKCTPQANGSAVMSVLTQTLPSSNDGYIYIFLGVATSSTAMELYLEHPVYYHDGTGIRLWTGAASGGGGGTTYVIDVSMSYGSITSYDLHSATAADISSALSADPETKVILKIAVDEEVTPVVVVPSLGNRANAEFSAIYMRALFSALDYSMGDTYGYDITLRLNASGLDVMHYQSTSY